MLLILLSEIDDNGNQAAGNADNSKCEQRVPRPRGRLYRRVVQYYMTGLPDDPELPGRLAARFLCRRRSIKENPIRSGEPIVPQNTDDRRRDKRSGPAGATRQSFREAAWPSGGLPFDPR